MQFMFTTEHCLKTFAFHRPQAPLLSRARARDSWAPAQQGIYLQLQYVCKLWSLNLGSDKSHWSAMEVTEPRTIFSKLPGMIKLATKPKREHLGNGPRPWVSLYDVQANSSFKILQRLLLHDRNAFLSAWPKTFTQEVHCGIVPAHC